MNSVQTAMSNVAESYGIDAVDEVLIEWIKYGELDEAVLQRAKVLEYSSPTSDYLQKMHRDIHPNGPYGFEHCADCIQQLGLK